MNAQPPVASETVRRRIGRDRITLRGSRLLILSPVEMGGWDLREHRKPLIHFEGRTWQIVGKSAGAEDRFRYELERWTPNDHELLGPEIHYGAEFVADRDREQYEVARRDRGAVALGFISPILGWLWSRRKQRIEERYGIDPVAATRRSLHIQYLSILLSIAGLAIGVMAQSMGGAAPWPLRPLIWIVVLATPDAIMRWDRVMAEERYPFGFFEWIVPRRR